MRLFVDLGVGPFDMKFCFLNDKEEKLDSFSVSNDVFGAQVLKERLL